MNTNSKIYLAGHKGLVGSAILRLLKKRNYKKIILEDSSKLDLRNQEDVRIFFKKKKPEYVILAAAYVGGIIANNKFRGKFIYDNLIIQSNIIHESYLNKVKKLIFLGSSCVYPKGIFKSIKEEDLLSGFLEKTNEPYAVAKIAGIKLCENYNYQYRTNFVCLMPPNIYGPYDNFDLENSHFIPAIIRKVFESHKNKKKKIILWGSGSPKREVMYVDDLANAVLYFLKIKTKDCLINVGTGYDDTIKNYAKKIIKILNLNLNIEFDKTKPDGVKRKLLNIDLCKKYKWKSKISFKEGILKTYKFYVSHFENNKK